MWWAEHEDWQPGNDDGWFVRLILKCVRMGLYGLEFAVRSVAFVAICAVAVGFFMLIDQNNDGEYKSWGQVERATEAADAAESWRLDVSDQSRPYEDEQPRHAEGVRDMTRQEYNAMVERDYEGQMSRSFNDGEQAAAPFSAPYDPGLVDCDEFPTWDHADAFFRGAGGPGQDLYWLDDDKDGIPCELLPRWDEVYGE